MTLLRSSAALVLKEIQHHIGTFIGLGILTLPSLFLALVLNLGTGGVSFVASATGLIYYWIPVVVFGVIRRLVVLEHEDGTHKFLASLPPPAWLRASVKWVVGQVAVAAIALPMFFIVVGLASLREIVSIFWAFQLLTQVSLVIMGWTAVTFAVAHLGRFRHWVWLGLMASLVLFDEIPHWQQYTWFAALAEPTDAYRHHIPWAGMATSAAWIVAGTTLGLWLASFRGGQLPVAWYRTSSALDRVLGASVIILWMLVAEVYPEMGAGSLFGWETLPEVAQDVHVATDALHPWGAAVGEAQDRLHGFTKAHVRSRIVLIPEAADVRPLASPVRIGLWDRDQVIFRVKGPVDSAGVARIIRGELEQRSAGALVHATDRGWLRDGLGLYVSEPLGDRKWSERRAAYAISYGLKRDDLLDWEGILDTWGEDVASGIGAVGIREWAKLAGEDKAGAVVQDVLMPVLPEDSTAAWRMAEMPSQPAGVSADDLADAWWMALQQAHDRRSDEVFGVPRLQGTVQLVPAEASNVDVGWRLNGSPPDGAELVVWPIAPLRLQPVYDAPVWILLVNDNRGVGPTWAPDHSQVRATVRVWSELLQGHVVMGWQRLEEP